MSKQPLMEFRNYTAFSAKNPSPLAPPSKEGGEFSVQEVKCVTK